MTAPRIHPVIMSGGAGTRLWPLSRRLYPKQLLPLVGDQTLLQETALRFTGEGFAPPLVICNAEHRFLIAEQMQAAGAPPAQIALEPVGRNTAPAAVVAALLVAAEAPDDLLLLAPSDHAVRDPAALRAAIAAAAADAAEGALLVFGVVPNKPHTGYGYIRAGDERLPGGAMRVAEFVEKPNAQTAAGYVEAGGYFWNAGMFLFRASTLLEEMERLEPAMMALCRRAIDAASVDLDFLRLDAEAFGAIKGDSLDYALMERTARAAVRPIDVGWSDVGSWQAMWEAGGKDDAGNVVAGTAITLDAVDSYVRSTGPLVAAVGIEGLVVVATPDAVLVVPRGRAEAVRDAVEGVEASGYSQHESHVEVHRPWGSFRTLHFDAGYQVKQLTVKPGAAISLQYHNKRAEHWVVVGGRALVHRGGEDVELAANQSTYIPVGAEHRLENPGSEPLIVIEVQTGDYLGEDDIVRLEDRYGRG